MCSLLVNGFDGVLKRIVPAKPVSRGSGKGWLGNKMKWRGKRRGLWFENKAMKMQVRTVIEGL